MYMGRERFICYDRVAPSRSQKRDFTITIYHHAGSMHCSAPSMGRLLRPCNVHRPLYTRTPAPAVHCFRVRGTSAVANAAPTARLEGILLDTQLDGLELLLQEFEVVGRMLRMVCPKDPDEVLDRHIQAGTDGDPYWTRVWPSAIALASEMLRRPQLVQGMRVADLGGAERQLSAVDCSRACTLPKVHGGHGKAWPMCMQLAALAYRCPCPHASHASIWMQLGSPFSCACRNFRSHAPTCTSTAEGEATARGPWTFAELCQHPVNALVTLRTSLHVLYHAFHFNPGLGMGPPAVSSPPSMLPALPVIFSLQPGLAWLESQRLWLVSNPTVEGPMHALFCMQ